jgi:putative transposase
MPRARRIHINGGLYHVTLRGNHRDAIFELPEDRAMFESILAAGLERHHATIHAYCWMTNHVHAIVQVADRPLGKLIQLVASRYARHFQKRVPTTGHLFQRRHGAKLITDTAYLLQAVRYTHLNPVAAGMVADPSDYPWSSHRHYLSGGGPAWLRSDYVLGKWGPTRREALAAYLAHLGTPHDQCDARDWVEDISRRTRPNIDAETPGAGPPPPDLDTLMLDVARRHGVSPEALASGSRARALSAVRAALAHEGLSSGAATLTEIAARLNRAPSTVSALLARYVTRK